MRKDSVDWLRNPRAIRERCHALLELGKAGKLAWFAVEPGRLDEVVDYVLAVTREAYPTGEIPLHSRWGHFDVGGVKRNAELQARLAGLPAAERARVKVDLVVTSVLLDAGSGPTWKYVEEGGGTYSRSEGLAVASFRMFMAGTFSMDKDNPLRADSGGLMRVRPETLARAFQVSEDNPLEGLQGRLSLLHGLGLVLSRPGKLFDFLAARKEPVQAAEVLELVLLELGPIWPGRVVLEGVNLGDVWPHPAVGLVPFHKLSQWLTYSLVEPLEEGGVKVLGLEALTGLPEYRNGGLLVDMGVLVPKQERLLSEAWPVGSEPIVEWRALTVALLDEVAERMRKKLGRTAAELPLVKVLQGGTWSAGRKVAAERRPGGGPPIRILSDGTVF